MTGNASRQILLALAQAAGPLPTSELAAIYQRVHPVDRQAALNHTNAALRFYVKRGKVIRAGGVRERSRPGPPATLWRITDAGLASVSPQCQVPAVPHRYPCWCCVPRARWSAVRAPQWGW